MDPLGHEPEAVGFAREKAGLTKTEVAVACGVSLSLISEIEAGTRNATPAMLDRLAEVLNCPRVVLERKCLVPEPAIQPTPAVRGHGSANPATQREKMTGMPSSGDHEELSRRAEKMTQLVSLIQEYPAEAQLVMAAIEDGLPLGPAQILDAARREMTPRGEAGAGTD
jgi:transcriptional regulator with XRE-family HTH domain